MKLCIRNDGEIDNKALFLLGASTKEGQDKIGFFGSGNKYAIATLLRMGVPFEIYSGTRRLEITTRTVDFGEQQFEQIVLDGVDTSFTTRMGPAWELWFAIREFYCNALDEGGASWGMGDGGCGSVGKTTIYIDATPEVNLFWRNRASYILTNEDKKLYRSTTLYGDADVYDPIDDGSYVFRKGIRVFSNPNGEAASGFGFWYSISNIDINESRVASYEYQILVGIAQAMMGAPTITIVKRMLDAIANSSTLESRAGWYYVNAASKMNEAWAEFLADKDIMRKSHADYLPPEDCARATVLPDALVKILEQNFPNLNYHHKIGSTFQECSIPNEYAGWAEKAIQEVADWGYTDKAFTYKFGSFSNPDIMGLCDKANGVIMLSIKHFSEGYEELLATVVEEVLHTQGYNDGTRSFEVFLIRELVAAKRSQK
jgi:hypothetical protein